jgi:cytochrome c
MSSPNAPVLEVLIAAAAVAWLGAAAAQATLEGPQLGVAATPDQVASWDVSVGPDGATLPPGSGTAKAGAAVYAAKCVACHNKDGAGQPNDQLAGGQGTLRDAAPVRTIGSYWPYATTVFDYVRRAMPYVMPHSLSDDETYALTAYLLFINDVIGETDVIDARTLPAVQMPNRANFVSAWSDRGAARTRVEPAPSRKRTQQPAAAPTRKSRPPLVQSR